MLEPLSTSVLVGNGINQLRGSSYSWHNVLVELANACGRPELAKDRAEKPFTLLFEEMVLCSEDTPSRESRLKQLVAKHVDEIQPMHIHERIRNLPVRHILTPNYDYALERAIDRMQEPTPLKRESRYSLFRRRQSGEQYIWHIHGEADHPATIMLGYDHYVGYLAKTKTYLMPLPKRRRASKEPRSPFINGIANFEDHHEPFSWVDLFLHDDVHILGFGLDYTEIGIWWLITYKARLRAKDHRGPNGIAMGSTHYYYIYPGTISARDEGRLEMLRGMGVCVEGLNAQPEYLAGVVAYERAIRLIEAAI